MVAARLSALKWNPKLYWLIMIVTSSNNKVIILV